MASNQSIKKRFFRLFAQNWPFYNRFGFYSLFPIYFASGCGIELFMIKFKFYSHSFYRTFNRRQLENIKEEIEEQEILIKELTEKINKLKNNN